jgi:hypothetical protein
MIALIRLVVVGLVVMTVFYFLISIYSRSLRKEKLENRWQEEGGTGDRDTYVEEGLKRYDASIRPKLILLVYVVPTLVVGTIFYVISFS